MTASKPNINRLKILGLALLLILTCLAIGGLFAVFFPGNMLDTFIPIFLIALAVGLPIKQKHFSLYSITLLISGILFIGSGAITYAYHDVIDPLPVISQIEFSKVLRPVQVSMGLSEMAFAVLYVSLAFVWLQKVSLKSKSKYIKLFWVALGIIGIVYAFQGVTSVIAGLSRL
jgi:hypothetical protein